MRCFAQVLLIVLLAAPAAQAVFAQQTAPQQTAQGAGENKSGAAPAVLRRPDHPITLEQMQEMFQIMHFRSTMNAMLHVNLQQQRQAAPFVPEDVWQDFEDSFGKVDFIPVFLPVYQRYLSEEDATKALEFYRTPAGQHTLSVMPALMQEISLAAQAKGEEIAQQVFERHHQEIEDAQKKYQRQAPPSTAAPPNETQPK